MTRRYISNRFLAPDVIDTSIALLFENARDENVTVALAGGIAMQLYGSTRLTGDIDVIASEPLSLVHPEHPLALVPGYTGRLDTGVTVDLIVPEEAAEWYDLFTHAMETAVPLFEDGIPVVLPEYLVAMKMVADREDKDLGDLYFLLTEPGVTDIAKTRRVIRKEFGAYGVKDFEQLLAEAEWAATRRSRKERT